MNERIIDTTNYIVKPGDTLIHHGDFVWPRFWSRTKYTERIASVLASLKCKNVILLRGNHDRVDWPYCYEYAYANTWVFCSHYRHDVWNKSHYGSINLYGHSHGKLEPRQRTLDVGFNVHNRPLSIEECIQLCQ